LPAIFEHLQANGLTTAGGCGDTVRNITGCPVADIDRHQLFDVQPLIQEAAHFFYGNREYSNLPENTKLPSLLARSNATPRKFTASL
jgi:sulfite reductase beta subunit-like hemoprotein